MKHAREIVGLPVILYNSGLRAGRVCKVLTEPDKRKISGLLIKTDSIIKREVFIAFSDICLIGDVSVFIRCLHGAKIPQKRNHHRPICVRDCHGEEMGLLADYLIDEKKGSVIAVEVSGGFWEDVRGGRQMYRCFAKVEFSEDIVITPNQNQSEKR